MKNFLRNIRNEYTNILRLVSVAMLLIFSSTAFQTVADDGGDSADIKVTPIKRATPIYPKFAVNKGIEGTVLIIYSIEKDGNVSDIEVVASDQDGLFDASAILGVQKWVYTKPAKKLRNKYVAIEFALTDEPDTSKFANVEKIQIRGK